MGKTISSRSITFAVALTAAVVGSPAAAAPAPDSPRWAKTEAIIGGASALQAILAQQQGFAATPQVAVQPASYSAPPRQPAILHERPRASAAALSGRPDVFGTVALKVTKTPLNARWRKVERARIAGQAARYAEALGDLPIIERLEAVNRYVNRRVRFAEDQREYGRPDFWSPAEATLTRGRGDCEDYAIAKLQMLRRAGLADRDLYLVIVKDLISRSDHAVLVVRAADRLFVLDNGTDRLLDSEEIRDYRPVLTFAAGGAWTHGYRVRSAPVEIASADASAAALAPSAPQRSWSASLRALSTGLSR